MRPLSSTISEAPEPAPARRGGAGWRLTALRHACVAAPMLASTLLVVVVAPLLPDWVGSCVFYGGLGVAILLGAGVGEPTAVRALFGARKMTRSEEVGLATVVSELCHLKLGASLVDLYVNRHPGRPHVVARGRRSIVLSAEFVRGIQTGRLAPGEAVAVLAHGSITVRSGLVRFDPLAAFWSLPWRALTRAGRPLRGVFGFAWRIRLVVVGIAIWQCLTERPDSQGSVTGFAIAGALTVVLVLTYVWPRLVGSWDGVLTRAADQALADRGLGRPMAAFLRRLQPTPSLIERAQILDPPARPRPILKVVGS